MATDRSYVTMIDMAAMDKASDALLFALEHRDPSAAIVALFPEPTTPGQVLQFAKALAEAGDAWHVDLQAGGEDIHIAIEHRPVGALASTAMGFAPFHTMPLTRRAPVTAIALWSGGLQNEFHPAGRGDKRKQASFADMPHGRDKAAHDDLWRKSDRSTTDLGGDPTELRKMTFRLPIT